MKRTTSALRVIAAAGLMAAAVGCQPKAEKDVTVNVRTRPEDGDKAKDLGQKIEHGAQEAGAAVGGAVREAGREMDAAKQTFDVKAALMADTTIDASNVNVNTDDKTKTVTLNGTVPTAAQKTAAEQTARDKAVGYTVVNNLTVAPKY